MASLGIFSWSGLVLVAWLGCLALFDVQPLHAQSTPDSRWTLFAQEKEGLISNDVTTILVKDGELWLGTNEGISRYNGVWTSFPRAARAGQESLGRSAPDGRIQALAVSDRPEGLWAGTATGQIAFWDGNVWSNAAMADAEVLALAEVDGVLWVGTENGLWALAGQELNPVAIVGDSSVQALLASGNDLWVGTDAGLWRKTGNEWVAIDAGDDLFGDGVYALWMGADGSMWVGTTSGIVWRESGESSWQYLEILDEIGVPAPVQTLAGDGDGVIWAGTDGAGAVNFDRATGTLVRFGLAGDPNLTTRSSVALRSIKTVRSGWRLQQGYSAIGVTPGSVTFKAQASKTRSTMSTTSWWIVMAFCGLRRAAPVCAGEPI
ncbi:MAG: hypothetical protein HC802_19670 [Caldilineaceae bacterium]|nr:hypothetical protein [Caldilineaceae bacterium]